MSEGDQLVPVWFRKALVFVATVVALAAAVVQVIADAGAPARDKGVMLGLVSVGLVLCAASALLLYHAARLAISAFGATVRANRVDDLIRALLFTFFGIGAMVVNSFLLSQFFGTLIVEHVLVLGLALPISLVMSVLYSLIGFSLGISLQIIQTRAREEGRFQLFSIPVVALIAMSVLLEVALYAIVSFSIEWPWPVGFQAPQWLNGWLALMGLLIGGGVVTAGYMWGESWNRVLEANRKREAQAFQRRMATEA